MASVLLAETSASANNDEPAKRIPARRMFRYLRRDMLHPRSAEVFAGGWRLIGAKSLRHLLAPSVLLGGG